MTYAIATVKTPAASSDIKSDEIECQVRLRGGARDEFHLATYPPQNMK